MPGATLVLNFVLFKPDICEGMPHGESLIVINTA